jgi:hypothetical protein
MVDGLAVGGPITFRYAYIYIYIYIEFLNAHANIYYYYILVAWEGKGSFLCLLGVCDWSADDAAPPSINQSSLII